MMYKKKIYVQMQIQELRPTAAEAGIENVRSSGCQYPNFSFKEVLPSPVWSEKNEASCIVERIKLKFKHLKLVHKSIRGQHLPEGGTQQT